MANTWITKDDITAARLNQQTLQQLTGAEINALSPTYAGQVVFCTSTGSGFTADHIYLRNAANSAWLEFMDLSGTQTATNKTFTSPSINTSIGLLAQAESRYYDSDSSNYVGFKGAASISANLIMTLPSADGAAKTFLATDGSAVLSFINPAKILTDDYTTSTSSGNASQTLKTYSLGANSFTRIYVVAYGKIQIPASASSGSNSVTVNIGANSKSLSYDYPDWATGQTGTLTQNWFIIYSIAQTGAATVSVTCAPNNTDTPSITCEGFVVMGLNY